MQFRFRTLLLLVTWFSVLLAISTKVDISWGMIATGFSGVAFASVGLYRRAWLLVLVGIFLLPCVFLVCVPFCAVMKGCGSAQVTLKVKMLNTVDQQPISGVAVELRNPEMPTPLASAMTDSSGLAVLNYNLLYNTSDSMFASSAIAPVQAGLTIDVIENGHPHRRLDLQSCIGRTLEPIHRQIHRNILVLRDTNLSKCWALLPDGTTVAELAPLRRDNSVPSGN